MLQTTVSVAEPSRLLKNGLLLAQKRIKEALRGVSKTDLAACNIR
jgi:hypothetical protein